MLCKRAMLNPKLEAGAGLGHERRLTRPGAGLGHERRLISPEDILIPSWSW